jgi:uncharacterized damage-inducible protein DinB
MSTSHAEIASLSLDELLRRYAQGPQMLRTVVDGVSNAQFGDRPVPGKWSMRELIAHLADFESVQANRVKWCLAEERPTLPDGDEVAFAARLGYESRDVEEDLRLIELTRSQLSRILAAADPVVFERVAIHDKVGEQTLRQLVEHPVEHLLHHLAFAEEKRAALAVDRGR